MYLLFLKPWWSTRRPLCNVDFKKIDKCSQPQCTEWYDKYGGWWILKGKLFQQNPIYFFLEKKNNPKRLQLQSKMEQVELSQSIIAFQVQGNDKWAIKGSCSLFRTEKERNESAREKILSFSACWFISSESYVNL